MRLAILLFSLVFATHSAISKTHPCTIVFKDGNTIETAISLKLKGKDRIKTIDGTIYQCADIKEVILSVSEDIQVETRLVPISNQNEGYLWGFPIYEGPYGMGRSLYYGIYDHQKIKVEVDENGKVRVRIPSGFSFIATNKSYDLESLEVFYILETDTDNLFRGSYALEMFGDCEFVAQHIKDQKYELNSLVQMMAEYNRTCQ